MRKLSNSAKKKRERMSEWMDGWVGARMNRRMDGWMDGRTDKRTDGWMDTMWEVGTDQVRPTYTYLLILVSAVAKKSL